MLRIYYSSVSALPDQPEDLPLSEYRLRQLSSCRSPLRRRQGIAAELLLIHGLRSWEGDCALPLRLETEEGGKPFLPEKKLFFSLSHSGDIAACALCDTAAGIDLERERPMHETLLRRCFSEEEQRMILNSDTPASAFLRLWTMKESTLKATGDGLSALRGLNMLAPPPGFSYYHTKLGGYQLSVCVRGQSAAPEVLESVDLIRAFFPGRETGRGTPGSCP